MVNGVVVDEPSEVKQPACSHFQNLFSEHWRLRPRIGGDFKKIDANQAAAILEREFTEEEVWAAIKDCDGNKAPGPDGFNMMFFQKGWKFLKGNIMKFMKEFYSNNKLGYGVNCFFVSLIPKKENPSSLLEYRPISLINSPYKVLSKVLANRIRLVLPSVIDKAQSTFVGGRNIMDGVLIANEVVDWWKKSRKKGLSLKLDFQKAYDTVNWNCLLQMLSSFGFGLRWIRWMKECMESVRISILVNGSPYAEFYPQKGSRHGDPLSSFLFNVVAEGLNILLSRAKELRFIKGVVVGNGEVDVSHLQFADDTIILCEAEWAKIMAVK